MKDEKIIPLMEDSSKHTHEDVSYQRLLEQQEKQRKQIESDKK